MELELSKLCIGCGKYKPMSEFYIKKNGKPHSWCDDCRKIKKREWDLVNKEMLIIIL